MANATRITRSMPAWGKTALDIVLGVGLIAGLGTVFGFFGLWTDSWMLGLAYPLIVLVVALIGIHFTIKVGGARKRWGAAIGYTTVVVDTLITLGVIVLTQRPNFVFSDFGYGALCALTLIFGVILVRIYRWLTVKYH